MTDNFPILNYLSLHSLSSIVKNQRVVTLPDTCTIERALDTLARNHVRSAPVLNSSNKNDSDKILGIVGTIDICYYMLQIAPNPTIMTKRELNNFFMDGYGISNEKIYKIIDKSNLNPVEVFSPSVNLKSVVSTCLSRGVHRVLIMEDNEIVSTISRSDIVRFLYNSILKAENDELHPDHPSIESETSHQRFGRILKNTKPNSPEEMSELQQYIELLKAFGSKPIKGTIANILNKMTTCKDIDPVLLVLDSLKDCGHKSLPVVDNEGKLVSNFSSSEVTALVKDAWPSFGENVMEYKKHTNAIYGGKLLPPVYTTENATIMDVLKKLVGGSKSIHCIWIVDSDMKPIGSISLTDILRFASNWNGE